MKLGNASAVRGMHEGLSRNLLGFGTGPSGAASFVGALDDYTADMAGAWSVSRRLLSSYEGPLIRVRRTSDNAEADIGYDEDGNLDEAVLLAHVGVSSGQVAKVYGQFAAKDQVQATAGVQPRIVNAGVIDRGSDGAPAMLGGRTEAASMSGTDWTLHCKGDRANDANYRIFWELVGINTWGGKTNTQKLYYQGGPSGVTSMGLGTNRFTYAMDAAGTNAAVYLNGVSDGTVGAARPGTVTALTWGAQTGGGNAWNSYCGELVAYNTLQNETLVGNINAALAA